ncbi:MAG: DUF47 family protein [Acidimicrobiales bacterium]|nr:DUF47 family protein [Acidimicrobiales bacterium]
MRFRLVPSNDEFFEQFNRAAVNLQTSIRALRGLVEDFTDVDTKHARVREAEKVGDQVTRDILHNLDTTFVTPFDREDIHALAEGLDDVVDGIYHLSEVLTLVPIHTMLPEFREQVAVIDEASSVLVELFGGLAAMKGLKPLLERIDGLETAGDQIYRRTLGRLFSGEFDALEVLKWKDLVESAEDTMDKIEDVSDVVAAILVKHA